MKFSGLTLTTLLASFGEAAVTLFNGAQNITLSQKLSNNCFMAFNTSLNCPNNLQLLAYANQQVGWNTSTLNTLCTSACNSSLATLRSNVVSGCGSESFLLSGQNMTYPSVVDLFQYKYSLTCLKDTSSGSYCSDVENTWNITSMLAAGKATWPANTNKTYYDLSEWDWRPLTDENGTLIRLPDTVQWVNASYVDTSLPPAAMDYFRTPAAPADDSNYGWPAVLSSDELPIEIQCSSCYLNRYVTAKQSKWGDIWDEMAVQEWANMQKNCNVTTNIVPALNTTHTDYLVNNTVFSVNLTACPLVLNVNTPASCLDIARANSVPSASLRALNAIMCTSTSGSLCSSVQCPIAVSNATQNALNFASGYTNFTYTQFLTWNPFMNSGQMVVNDTVCVGPPGGYYAPAVATPAYPTVYTTTAKPAAPTLAGTIPNCGLYYNVTPSDSCNNIALNFSITLQQFYNMNCEVNSQCGNLYAAYDYCVGPVNGTNVTTCATTSTSSVSSAGSTTVPPPGPTMSGTSNACRQWYTVVSGDTCYNIEQTYSITSTQFYAWNPAINSGCTNLVVGDAYCVAGPPVSSTTTTTTATK